MHKRRNIAWLVALAVGLMLIPVANASAASKAEKKQNSAIKKNRKAIAKVAANVVKVTKATAANTTAISATNAKSDSIDTRLKVIEAGVPTIVGGLTQLKDASLQLQDGLLQLKAGLQLAGDNLTKLGAAYQAVEYGRAGVFASGAATPTVAAGGVATSADIPDDGNPVSTGDTAIVVAGATGLMAIDLTAAIRSNESDGDDVSKTAGQAGGFLNVIDLDTGVRVACGGTPNPPGIIGTTAGDSIVTPTGTVTNLPLKNIPGGVLRTDQSKPDSSSTSLLPAPCQFAGTIGHTYSVHYSVNFLDIPTSATPGPTE